MNNNKLFELASSKGIEELQIVIDSEEQLDLQYYNGQLEKNETSKINKVTVSGIVNTKLSTYSIEDLNMKEEDIINTIYENASLLNSDEEFDIYDGDEKYPEVEEIKNDFEEYSLEDKVNLLDKLEKALKAKDQRVVQIPEIQYNEVTASKQIINSKGLNISKKMAVCVLVPEIVVSDGQGAQMGYKVEVKLNFKDLDIEAIANEVVEKAVGKLGAEPIESGEYPVIIENEAMGSLLQAMCSMFVGEAHLKKVSPIQNKLNEKIFSEKITIKDEPLKEDALYKEPFDDEGVACFNKTIVENGVFKMMLHNLKTAKSLNSKPTGNGFSGATSPVNLYIVPGNKTKDELISSIEKGVILNDFDGLHAGLNSISGDFSLKTNGFYIENGKIVKPTTLIVLTGNFIKMMNDIEEIGSDLHIDFLSKVGSPSIKFRSLSISGK